MSNSAQPHRQQPTRLPRLWDSLGRNTRVGCHFLLQCMKVESESEVTQSCPTLSDLMDCSLPGSSVHGIFQARVLEWGTIAFSAGEFYPPQKKTFRKYAYWMNFERDSYYKNYPNQRKENLVYSPTTRKFSLCGPKVNDIVWAVPHNLEQDARRWKSFPSLCRWTSASS